MLPFSQVLLKKPIQSNSRRKFILCTRFTQCWNIDGSYQQDDNVKYYGGIPLHKPGKNFVNKNYIMTKYTNQLLEEHLQRTGGQVRTRFPPEPNGLLHIGHAKAINFDFTFAKERGGVCFLRYDDTNPEKEDDLFVKGIQEMVEWLGFKAYRITYASDYFPQLYEFAEKLIERDMAYVCHQPIGSSNEVISPWQSRPSSESLEAFRDMKNRKYKEGEATLRLKMTTDQKTIDPVAYRIKFAHHHRTADQWCIYPTYDYAHGLCDSIEDITHSFCTTEFALRRSTYYWVCNALDVYCPVQIEFGRLNLLYTVVSKRKIAALIEAGIVKGWDDPRLYTLVALRRRGVPPEAIIQFCSNFGLKTESSYINPVEFLYYVHKHLYESAPRIMAVFNPLKLVITNYPYEGSKEFEVPNVKEFPDKGKHTVHFDKEIWIERNDFMEVGKKNYRRLTPDQGVGLKHTSHVIYLKEIVRTDNGEVDYLKVEYIPLKEVKKKPKCFIHWVAKPERAEARLYENLFKSERPDDIERVPGGFLSDVNQDSFRSMEVLIGRCSLNDFKPYQRFQFERIGYFSVDPDTQHGKLVFNRIVELNQKKGIEIYLLNKN